MSKISLMILSLTAMCATSAAVSGSASATMPTATHPNGSLITGTLNFTGGHTGNAILKITIAGIRIEISCEEEHSEGTLENTTVDVLGLILVHYLKCTMPKPTAGNCLVQNHLMHLKAHVLVELRGTPGVYLALFHPDDSNIFTQITVESCVNSSINGTYTVEGVASALVNNSNLTLEFHKESGSKLTTGGSPVEYFDTTFTEMEGGGSEAGIMIENGS